MITTTADLVVAPFGVEVAPQHPVTAAFLASAFTAFCATLSRRTSLLCIRRA